jgi:hypothetical protein
MRYWKGLFIAAAFDAAMLVGPKVFAPPPEPLPVRPAVVELLDIDRQVDSLIARLQGNGADVDAMVAIARIYMERGWMDDAIGPLARALELDPYRRDLWVALDQALEAGNREKITDEELMAAARAFVEMIGMEGHGC